ncbi:MAG: type II toxin-antitoxin system RelE/ParE family toxin [Methylococcales bacterium]|nr:type II toxin-antitoxin system RelE/ParE family toxin [Methylococcales bacterium]
MKKQIHFSELSRTDLKDIYLYIAIESPVRGRQLIVEIIQCCEQTLAKHPQIGKIRPEIYIGLRSFVFKRYTIFYREAESAIEIIRILHGSRDVENALSRDAE